MFWIFQTGEMNNPIKEGLSNKAVFFFLHLVILFKVRAKDYTQMALVAKFYTKSQDNLTLSAFISSDRSSYSEDGLLYNIQRTNF